MSANPCSVFNISKSINEPKKKKIDPNHEQEQKRKNISIIIGLILWVILGLVISIPIAIYYGFRLFQNRLRKISGRYLNQH